MWSQSVLTVATQGRGFFDLQEAVARLIGDSRVQIGLCHLFLQHTSASLCITENADPMVHQDLERFARRLAPDGDPLFRHVEEGPDDMSGHVRTLFAGDQTTIPIGNGRLMLGTWQGIYVWEHRESPHQRRVVVTIQGQ